MGTAAAYSRVGTILMLAAISCATPGCTRDPSSNGPKDLAVFVVPPGSQVVENSPWVMDSWSAKKECTFDSRLTWVEYLAWAARALGADWRSRAAADGSPLFTRLVSGEQQYLEIRSVTSGSQGIRVRVTFTATAT